MADLGSQGTRSFYDAVAGEYARLLPGTAAEASVDLGMVGQFVADLGGTDVLDAGCGTGRMIGYLRSLDAALSVTGLDLSPAMLEEAKAGHPRAALVRGDLTALPFGEAAFDGVLAWYSIIHTPPHGLHRIFAEVHRVLRPGGVVLVGYQAGTGERTAAKAYGQAVSLHAYLHHTAYVEAALAEAGMSVVVRADRGPRAGERHGQGFVLARRV